MKGTVKQRNGSWQARLPYKNANGIWTARTGTAGSKEAAEALLRKFINEETKGLDMTNPLFKEVSQEWYNEKKLSCSFNSLRTYENSVATLNKWFGEMKIKDIKRKHISDFYSHIKANGLETKILRGRFNGMMLYAISNNYIMKNPGKEVKTARTKKPSPPKILTSAERTSLLKDFEDTRYYYPIAITLKTGMRLGELCGLTWDNVHFEEGYIEVKQQYTIGGFTDIVKSDASYRFIYMDEETTKFLKDMRHSPFTTPHFVFLDHRKVYEQFGQQLEPYEITPHVLRHNHATDLLSIMNPADAAKRMGHTVAEYIRTYVHASDDIQKQAVEKLPVLKSESDLNKSRNNEGGQVIELATRATSQT